MVSGLFGAWAASGIPALVLRNYDGLPDVVGNDIDVLVPSGRMREAALELKSRIRHSGWRLHNAVRFSPLSVFFHNPETREQCHVDLFDRLEWRGFSLLDEAEVFRRSREHPRGFRIPDACDEAILNLLLRLLYGGPIREKYQASIAEAVHLEPDAFLNRLAGAVGPAHAKSVVEKIRERDWKGIEGAAPSLRRAVVVQALVHRPLKSVLRLAFDAMRLAARWVRRHGLFVVMAGPDGCGKTSAGQAMQAGLVRTFYPENTLYLHWKPRLVKRRGASATPFGTPCTDPHGKPARPMPVSTLFFFWHVFEMIGGYWLKLRLVLFRNGLVMIDRYYYDFFVDPRRYRLRVPAFLPRLFYAMVPKPDLIFFFDAPPEVLQQRKKEVTPEESARQREAYLALARRLPQAHVIDTRQPVDAVAKQTIAIVLDHLARRQERRD